ncbi:Major Facilitator Superfamily protein [Thermomonospora echinospora]|uniref:Major Facilitator Superfamily protein n=1 Tax=Thermomonospora echinospora TaxID=1992 RepID=A0A1H6E485_9ACTN|nr:MFS transporter [Thermomonospora echinospora]SEG92397.1 Major Facilitator Superfamily protein [Thermomonospora echinospora]
MGFRSRLGRSARAAGTGARRAGGAVRRVTHANGAGRSGLGGLIETAGVNGAGDALVAVALAGTLFFGLDVNEARGQVALYLLVTMAPFALVAPLIGPALDRMRHARRYAIAGTMLARGLLCWGMAGAVTHGDQVTLLPAAFGVLVLSKAFGVLRSAVTPRLLPDQITLVTANARASFAGLIAASTAAVAGAGLAVAAGPDWVLRIATVVFVLGAVLAMRLPAHVDVPEPAPATATGPGAPPAGRRWRTLPRVGPVVAEAMQANAALRAFSGFLILYLAFLLRERRFEPVSHTVALGLLAACAGAGGLAGTGLGAWTKARAPHLMVFATLTVAAASAAAAAVFFGLWAALAVAFVGGFGQSLGKLAMDAVVQREIGEEVRSSTFAVSETLHQLVWVLGGLAGLGLSIVADGRVALAGVAAVLGLALAALLAGRARRSARRRTSLRKNPPEPRREPV